MELWEDDLLIMTIVMTYLGVRLALGEDESLNDIMRCDYRLWIGVLHEKKVMDRRSRCIIVFDMIELQPDS